MREFAIQLAKEAGQMLKDSLGKIKTVDEKSKHNLVTNVDKEVDTFIKSKIEEKYPDHSILLEESGEETHDSEYLWVVDPLDGTTNYVHNFPLFGVSIALCKDRKPILGVIYQPMVDKLLVAEKGKGATCNGEKIIVSKRGFDDNTMMTFDSYMLDKTDEQLELIRKLMKHIVRIRLPGASVFEITMVAEGGIELSISRTIKPWDIAAACFIVEEAGGRVTDNLGNPWTIDTEYVVSSNGIVHDKILEIIK